MTKRQGSKAPESTCVQPPCASRNVTAASSPNSTRACRQAPQGETGNAAPSAANAATAIAASRKAAPSLCTAVAMAARSAQPPTGNAAFSTLQPTYTAPLTESNAAPTLSFEYGAYARRAACVANARNSSRLCDPPATASARRTISAAPPLRRAAASPACPPSACRRNPNRWTCPNLSERRARGLP